MKRLISSLIIMFITLSSITSYAQVSLTEGATNSKAPDMVKIKEIATSKKYDKLLSRYENNDPTLTLDEYRQVYYGFVYQSKYNPFNKEDYGKDIAELYYKEMPTRLECDKIIECAEKSLKDDPFNLEQMNYLIYAYKLKKKHFLANYWQTRLINVLKAILSTGSGDSKENAWYVIDIGHEYALINYLGNNYIVDKPIFYEPHFDFITLKQTSRNIPKGLYFNIKYPTENYNKRYK